MLTTITISIMKTRTRGWGAKAMGGKVGVLGMVRRGIEVPGEISRIWDMWDGDKGTRDRINKKRYWP